MRLLDKGRLYGVAIKTGNKVIVVQKILEACRQPAIDN